MAGYFGDEYIWEDMWEMQMEPAFLVIGTYFLYIFLHIFAEVADTDEATPIPTILAEIVVPYP